jgi:glyoxylase-like metal-dependent hydrolase (beta-lactamase superfamily II)
MMSEQSLPEKTSANDKAPLSVQIGEFTVTALSDGFFDVPAPFLLTEDGRPLPGSDDPFHIDVNAFLIRTPRQTLLVDAGSGPKLGPTVNRLASSLRTAGVASSSIDAVLCTHMHPDHTNGLIDVDGRAVFPNAQIYVHQNELDFWSSDEEQQRAPDALKFQFTWAREAFAPYAGKIHTFREGEVVDRVEAAPLFGHTPGHCGFIIDGGGREQLIIWGDCAHAIAMQSRNPGIAVVLDVDQEAARHARRTIFDRAAAEGAMVTGMHVNFPGFGHMSKSGTSFAYIPHS